MSGTFITFEGGEGSGKSTQVKMLASALREAGYKVVQTREPGGSPSAERIRDVLVKGDPGSLDEQSETLLFTAARRRHLIEVVMPALERGEIVVCDRFIDSTVALQGIKNVDRAGIMALHEAYCFDIMPTLTILFDIDPEFGLTRAGLRESAINAGENRFEAKGLEFHKSVRAGFLDQAKRNSERFAVLQVDGSIYEMHKRVMSIVRKRLGLLKYVNI